MTCFEDQSIVFKRKKCTKCFYKHPSALFILFHGTVILQTINNSFKCCHKLSGGTKGGPGRHLYRGGNFARKCISTTPIGASIYIWPRAAIPPAPPLDKRSVVLPSLIAIGNKISRLTVYKCTSTSVRDQNV